ncbi:MAG: pyruvate formate-lyase, partial [Alistipes sp.]|nr:pyruvate formate-lyase [Alistipes sp.]
MATFNIETAQNVEISKKIPCEKPLLEQLEIMERYTAVHREHLGESKEKREAACLQVLYPTLFRHIQEGDLIAGRLDFLPIGFGCVTSVGGVGHYCVFRKLKMFRAQLPESEHVRVDAMYDYWRDHDLKTAYNKETLQEGILGMFIDTTYPMIATARLSGMMLDYPTLLALGIGGLRKKITDRLSQEPDNAFLQAGITTLDIFVRSARHLKTDAQEQLATASEDRAKDLNLI